MANLSPPPPNAEQLATELRELHHGPDREPLSADEEARCSELAASSQPCGAGRLGGPGQQVAEVNAPSDIPEEWLAAFTEEQALGAEPQQPVAAEGADLVSEWEAWQAKQSGAVPFDFAPDDHGSGPGESYDALMSARAEALGCEAPGVESGFAHEELAPGAAALEPVLEPEPEPAPASAAAPAAHGARRVVIHLADGQVLRGQVLDVDVSRETFSYIAAAGSTESVPRSEVRTVFFMRAPGAAAAAGEGAPVRVVLRDGRELAGWSADHAGGRDGFTLVPDGARSTAALVCVARTAVRSVVAGS